ncbi:MFS transporter [Solirubrobacter deserti]|uniref:MFS transporter n=1 Tax=Solirubrobacter deserti TaxID=2282478 RepID=A0ABT4RFQ4_9ACTN|nr:MFS transporter [Solirubrobacter deserti]MDA0137378.1 MFS transporter [Solirubrobacter deserti]
MTRDLRLLSAAIAVSAAGDMLLMVVLALRVHELTGSGFAVAGLFAALMVPVVVLAGWAGRLVDRVETRRVLLLVSSAQVAVAGGLVFADGVASILVLTALLGATAAVAGPAEAALVPAVAAGGDLTRANGWVETARYVGFTAGPLLASVLIAAGGTGLGLIVNAASFGVVAAAAALLRARRVPSAAARRDAGGGLPLLLGDAVLRAPLVPAGAALLFIAASLAVEGVYVRDVVGAGPAGYSLVIAGWTAGMVLGAVAFAPRVTAPLAVAALAALALQGGGMAASALWAILPWAFAGYFVGGVGHGIKNVLLRTLIQRRVPADAHGRAFAAYNAARNTAELGALGAGGVLVGVLGAQPALILAGLGPVIAAAIGLALLRPRRRALEPAFAAR